MSGMKNKWIPFTVTHNGPTKDITVKVNGKTQTYKADGTVNKFHFKFGPYGKQKRNNTKEKFEAHYRNVSVKINRK